MLAIISEYRYNQQELQALQGKAIVNYTLLPQFYQSYAMEIARINYTLIKKSTGIIFRLSNYYAGTKDAIEYALALTKPRTIIGKLGETKVIPGRPCNIKIITPEGNTFKLDKIEEWKYSYKDNNNRNITVKHPILLAFEEKRNTYYEAINLSKAKERYQFNTENITESQEEIERFVRALAPQYKVEVNYADWVELCQAYKSIKYYYDNNIPYELNRNEIYSSGAIEPEDTDYFTLDMFDTSNTVVIPYEEESFGDETLLEDTIYKGSVLI